MDGMTDDAVDLTPRETDILAARLIAKHIVNDSPAVVLWEDVPELSEQASGCSSRTVPCIPTHPRLKGEPVADLTPDPIDVIAGWLWLDDMDGLLGESARSASGELLDALTAAGLQIVPVVDDATRQEVEALVWVLTSMPTAIGPKTRSRSAELLTAAYLPPPRLTDASYSGRTDK